MRCPSDQQLNAFLVDDGCEEDSIVADHIGSCDTCQSRLADLTSLPALNSPSKLELPNYLSGLEDQLAIASTSAELPQPELPGYEIQGILGRGGMGVVYRARHVRLERDVALKVMAAGAHASPEYRRRLDREGQLLAKLDYPGILRIFDSGEHEGLPYLALELVTQGSLLEQLEQFRAPDNATRLIEILARTTDVAHQHGIVHRDLKPANILFELAENDRAVSDEHCIEIEGIRLIPKIVDFGLSKATSNEAATDVSVSRAMIGTPQYMSPEQATEELDRIGPATDIHALGIILHELLTGKRPFDASGSLNTLQRVRSHTPEAPSAHTPSIDATLDAIVLKCLEKNPADRFESASALADELSRHRAGLPAKHVHIKTSGKVHRLVLLGTALLGLAVFAGMLIEAQENRVESVDATKRPSERVTQQTPIASIPKTPISDQTSAPQWAVMTQREIAAWIISRNAKVVLSSHPHFNSFKHPLPDAKVNVSTIGDLKHLTSEEMELFQYLPDLERVELASGNFRGNALAHLNHCSKLNWLSLKGSGVTDEELEALNLDNLRVLKLGECNTTAASLPKIAAAKNLVLLAASASLVGDPRAATWFPKMTNITQLDIFDCNDQACSYLPMLPSLATLNLHHSDGITDSCLELIVECRKLTRAIFNRVDFRTADLRKLKERKTLEYLGLHHCQLGGVTPQELQEHFSYCTVNLADG